MGPPAAPRRRNSRLIDIVAVSMILAQVLATTPTTDTHNLPQTGGLTFGKMSNAHQSPTEAINFGEPQKDTRPAVKPAPKPLDWLQDSLEHISDQDTMKKALHLTALSYLHDGNLGGVKVTQLNATENILENIPVSDGSNLSDYASANSKRHVDGCDSNNGLDSNVDPLDLEPLFGRIFGGEVGGKIRTLITTVINVLQELDQMDNQERPVKDALIKVIEDAREALGEDYKYLFLTLVMLADPKVQSELWNATVITPDVVEYARGKSRDVAEVEKMFGPILLFWELASSSGISWEVTRNKIFTNESLAIIAAPPQVSFWH